MLTVYRASAGSGKTFQLVAEYLKLIIDNPFNYRHILAVTFTNKATNEMKSRILEQLALLADNQPSDYMNILIEENSLTPEKVRIRARKVLRNILHDYNRFSISTIDSFTQLIIKAFNRETGIAPNFVLGLDDDLILEEAVDRLLSKLDTDKQLQRWLADFSMEKIKENRSQQIERDIKLLGKELFKEKFQIFFPDKKDSVYTRENLESFRRELNKMIAWFESTIRKKAKYCIELLQKDGFSTDDLSYRSTGIGGYLKKLSEGIINEPKARVIAAEESAQNWYSKTHKQKDRLGELAGNHLQPLLHEILVFYRENINRYLSAMEVRKQLRVLGILTDLKTEIQDILHEKGILQLSDSNLLLSKIIGDTDSPFIYEKIGTRYKYFMLDEFQDTSALQWNNFRPLVANSLSEGHANMLAGDVKQSVYRWRNSDWNILASQVNRDFPHVSPVEIPLEKNWRSRINIIEFNNSVIPEIKTAMGNYLLNEIQDENYLEKFRNIYKHLIQEPGNPEAVKKGLAEIKFLENENFETDSAGLLVKQVKLLQDKGFKASEIAILIRKNKEGAKIVETFLTAAKKDENAAYNLTVLSNESLFLHASRGVNFVMLIIETIIDKKNEINKTALLYLWLSWLKPAFEKIEHSSAGGVTDDSDTWNKNTASWPIDSNYETVFEKELGEKIKIAESKILLTSLDETVTQICSIFGLFKIKSELPYLQALIDEAAEIKFVLSNDLSNFLLWWKEKGHETSVSINEEVDSVRLMTVHKAKGLEFESVLIPFFNWDSSWSGSQSPLLWCKPSIRPFNKFPLLPVKASKILAGTIFRDDYLEEKVNSCIDTLNLVYVAFTRAKSALFINCKKPHENKYANTPGRTVNSLLLSSLEQLTNKDQFSGCLNDDGNSFRYGELPAFSHDESPSNTNRISKYFSGDFTARLRLRINSEEFLMKDNQSRSVKNTGKLVHEILSEIETVNDIEEACNKAFKGGKINSSERKEISEKLLFSLKRPEMYKWFDGSHKVITERELLTPSKLLRPDRVMISGDRAVVLDYKWGEKLPVKHKKQVLQYAGILRECGFAQVEGYLWYINQDELEKVC